MDKTSLKGFWRGGQVALAVHTLFQQSAATHAVQSGNISPTIIFFAQSVGHILCFGLSTGRRLLSHYPLGDCHQRCEYQRKKTNV